MVTQNVTKSTEQPRAQPGTGLLGVFLDLLSISTDSNPSHTSLSVVPLVLTDLFFSLSGETVKHNHSVFIIALSILRSWYFVFVYSTDSAKASL